MGAFQGLAPMKNDIVHYDVPVGTKMQIPEGDIVVREVTDVGYKVVNGSGIIGFVSFQSFFALIIASNIRLKLPASEAAVRDELRLGGDYHVAALADHQRKMAELRLTLCRAMYDLRAVMQEGDPSWSYSQRKLSDPLLRKRICVLASKYYGRKIHPDAPPANGSIMPQMPKGRTINEVFRAFELCLDNGLDPLRALVPLTHKRGRRGDRYCWTLRNLMTNAVDHFSVSARKESISNIHRILQSLVTQENIRREENGLPPLQVPSEGTLSKHRKSLFSPTEAAVRDDGKREAHKTNGAGSTDLRALKVGEFGEMDEVHLSLVTTAKKTGVWKKLSESEKKALEKADEEIRIRLILLVLIDIATRMPLAWVVSDKPRAEATIELLAMAGRDKSKLKARYGCTGTVVVPVNPKLIKNDNGTGLRNATVKKFILSMGGVSVDARTHSTRDKPFIERHFGTVESVLLKILHGYTGRRPGDLKGYDAAKAGVLDVSLLYELLTVFYIDELPSMPHYGGGLWGQRPADVYEQIKKTRRVIAPADPCTRRIALDFKFFVKPTKDGVRVFRHIHFGSNELREALEAYCQRFKTEVYPKVTVYLDPEDLNFATIVLPRTEGHIRVGLYTTVFADLSLVEAANLIREARKEDTQSKSIHEERLMRVRLDRHEKLHLLAVDNKLNRSYYTRAELQKIAQKIMHGPEIIAARQNLGTVSAGNILSKYSGGQVQYTDIIDLEAVDVTINETCEEPPAPQVEPEPDKPMRPADELPESEETVSDRDADKLGRPKHSRRKKWNF